VKNFPTRICAAMTDWNLFNVGNESKIHVLNFAFSRGACQHK
jgi:hypothetical protein